jgi:hypothetical protein
MIEALLQAASLLLLLQEIAQLLDRVRIIRSQSSAFGGRITSHIMEFSEAAASNVELRLTIAALVAFPQATVIARLL